MYKSPLHIIADLEEDGSSINDPGFLLRLRKKLLAEFNLSNAPTLEINGKLYSKDDVIKTIDVLMGNPQMPLHIFVFQNKKLLDFLENDFSSVRLSEINSLWVPYDIRAMLNPILVERYAFHLKKAFHAKNFDRVIELIESHPHFQDEEKAVLQEEINKNLVNLQSQIQSVVANGCKTITTELEYLKSNSFVTFLNKLPPEFIFTINALVGDIINCMVDYQGKRGYNKGYLYYVSLAICKIQCDEDLMQLMRNNHKSFAANYGQNTNTEESWFSGRYISIIFFVIIFVLRIFSSTCSRDTKPDFSKISDYQKSIDVNPFDEFAEYRVHILRDHSNDGVNKTPAEPMDQGQIKSGKNPFRYILKNSPVLDPNDASLIKVVVKNKTSHDLIVTTFNQSDAYAYYFFKNKPDTLIFHKGDKISLYFGDSLHYAKSSMGNSHVLRIKLMFEAYFKIVDKKSLDIFERDYEIEMNQDYQTKNNKSLPVIKFTDTFFENGEVVNSQLQLKEVLLNSSDGEIKSLEEVEVTPKKL